MVFDREEARRLTRRFTRSQASASQESGNQVETPEPRTGTLERGISARDGGIPTHDVSKETVKIAQLNLNGGIQNTTSYNQVLIADGVSVAFLQDVAINKTTGRLNGFSVGWSQFLSTADCAKREDTRNAAIATRLGSEAIALSSGPHHVSVYIKTPNAELTFISVYARPETTIVFETFLRELQGAIDIAEGQILICGDFNARSTQWGYSTTDERGEDLLSLLLANSLVVKNEPGSPPTFIQHNILDRTANKGWPDITICTGNLSSKIKNWQVKENTGISDHHSIIFDLGFKDRDLQRHSLGTKFGKTEKFKKLVKGRERDYLEYIGKVKSATALDQVTGLILNQLTDYARQCYKMKKTPAVKAPSWWTPELRTHRNRVRALYRRFIKETNADFKEQRGIIFRREQARYKKKIKKARTEAWKTFCTNASDPYGTLFKIATGKFVNRTNLSDITTTDSERYSDCRLRSIHENFLKTLFITEPTPVGHRVRRSQRRAADITYAELRRIIVSIAPYKAPGYDLIDNKLLKHIFSATPTLLLNFLNKCLEIEHFPTPLKEAIVVLFKKPGKPANRPKSYRPICLLPALGKLLERVIHGRVSHIFYKEGYWHPQQYGFKSGLSTEHALENLFRTLEADRQAGDHSALVSIDISGAFDNLSWDSILRRLQASPCPAYLQAMISSFLKDRTVTLTTNGIKTLKETYGGCPQGSCLGPLLWNVVADSALRLPWPQHTRVQAFADDFMLVVRGKDKEELTANATYSLTMIDNWTQGQRLNINWDKTQVLYYNRHRYPGIGLMKREGLDNVRIGDRTIQSTGTLKYLGLLINDKHGWLDHCQAQVAKVRRTFNSLGQLTNRHWGIRPTLIKLWYKTVAEKILMYGASIWGLKASEECELTLKKCQRHFLLAITKANRTTSYPALETLSGLPPITQTLKYEAVYGQVSRLKTPRELYGTTYEPADYAANENIWSRHPKDTVFVDPDLPAPTAGLHIYTDGSKTEEGTGFAFVAYSGDREIFHQTVRINTHNSVFQAEVQAIIAATRWARTQNEIFVIHTDSLSAIMAINKPFNRNKQLATLLDEIASLDTPYHIKWVKAHVGTVGNERADELAKSAAADITLPELQIPWPRTLLKSKLKSAIMEEWQYIWTHHADGRITNKFFPEVQVHRLIGDRELAQVYTGHGHFPAYLERFKIWDTDLCACGERGDWLHYLTKCTLHGYKLLRPVTSANDKVWFSQVSTNKYLRQRVRQIVLWLKRNIEDIREFHHQNSQN